MVMRRLLPALALCCALHPFPQQARAWEVDGLGLQVGGYARLSPGTRAALDARRAVREQALLAGGAGCSGGVPVLLGSVPSAPARWVTVPAPAPSFSLPFTLAAPAAPTFGCSGGGAGFFGAYGYSLPSGEVLSFSQGAPRTVLGTDSVPLSILGAAPPAVPGETTEQLRTLSRQVEELTGIVKAHDALLRRRGDKEGPER